MESRIIKIILTGNTGVGKSRLSNVLIGKNGVCEVSDKGKSQTSECRAVLSEKFNNTMVIDTPGFLDSSGNEKDKINLEKIHHTIKTEKPNLICLVLNAASPRIDLKIQEFLHILCNMFTTRDIWNHFMIVATNAFSLLKEKDRTNMTSDNKKKKEEANKKFDEQIKKKNEEISGLILDIISDYYKDEEKNRYKAGVKAKPGQIPKHLDIFYVELDKEESYEANEEIELDGRTKMTLCSLYTKAKLLSPIGSIEEKLIKNFKYLFYFKKKTDERKDILVDHKVTKTNKFVKGSCIVGGIIAGIVFLAIPCGGGFILGDVIASYLGSYTAGTAAGIIGGVTTAGGVAGYKVSDIFDKTIIEKVIDDKRELRKYEIVNRITKVYYDGSEESEDIHINWKMEEESKLSH